MRHQPIPTIIKELTELRQAQRLSQKELAQRMGSTQPIISDLERGKASPTLRMLTRWAEQFDLQPALAPIPEDN